MKKNPTLTSGLHVHMFTHADRQKRVYTHNSLEVNLVYIVKSHLIKGKKKEKNNDTEKKT